MRACLHPRIETICLRCRTNPVIPVRIDYHQQCKCPIHLAPDIGFVYHGGIFKDFVISDNGDFVGAGHIGTTEQLLRRRYS